MGLLWWTKRHQGIKEVFSPKEFSLHWIHKKSKIFFGNNSNLVLFLSGSRGSLPLLETQWSHPDIELCASNSQNWCKAAARPWKSSSAEETLQVRLKIIISQILFDQKYIKNLELGHDFRVFDGWSFLKLVSQIITEDLGNWSDKSVADQSKGENWTWMHGLLMSSVVETAQKPILLYLQKMDRKVE